MLNGARTGCLLARLTATLLLSTSLTTPCLNAARVANFSDRIHPVDAQVVARTGVLMRISFRRFHDALLVATAQVHGHGLLTLRAKHFERWARVTLVTC